MDKEAQDTPEIVCDTVLATPCDTLVGQFVDQKYEVLEKIGEGGMGIVYKVMHRQLKRLFAMKVMTPGNSGFDKTRVERFDHEAKAASGLNHQNLVGINDYGVTPAGAPYVVMEFIEGQTIDQVIAAKGPFDDATAIDMFIQICDGLDYAHSKNIIHRDLKPSNIILATENGNLRVRILDFGIAKVNNPNDEQAKVLTQTGELIGSPQYMSPEQCLGSKLDGRSDVYSLGCVMFEMVTGRKLFVGDSAMAVMFMHMNERAPLMRTIHGAAKIRPELERIILQTLEKEPGSRYQNADDLKKDLVLVKAGKNPVKEVSQARRRFKALAAVSKIGAMVILAAVVIVAAVFAYTNLSKEPWQRTMEQANNELTSGHNLDSAELLFRKAYQQAKESKQSAQVQELILIQLSRTAADRNAPLESWQYASEALKLSRTHGEDFQRASILDAITQSYLDSQTPNLAVPYAEEAVTVRKNTLQAPHKFITLSLQSLGQVYRGTGKLAQAEKVDREALAMAIQLNPSNSDRQIADLYEQLSRVLKDQKKFSEAAENAQKALDVSLVVRGEDHRFTQKLQRLLKDLKAAQDVAKTEQPSR